MIAAIVGVAYAMGCTLTAGIRAAEPPQAQQNTVPTTEGPPPAAEHGQAAGPIAGMRMNFTTHNVPPEVVERGKNLFSVNCSFCHGSDAAGGAVGPNLLRSAVVLQDQNGETIGPIVHGALASKGMPRIDLTDAQISDIAGFLHSLQVSNYAEKPEKPIDIVVGDAMAGKQTFVRMCGSCHSVDGDLAHIASKVTDPRALQQAWLLPSGPGAGGFGRPAPLPKDFHIPPMTVTVTLPSGKSVEGTLERVDDFYVGLTTKDGQFESFERDGDVPKVVLHDPMEAHRELLRRYTDKEIHDITAYLVTVK